LQRREMREERRESKQRTANRFERRVVRSCLLTVWLGCLAVQAQQIQLGDAAPVSGVRRQHVELETAAATVKAGAADWVELRFQVEPGMHINSHTPKDELLVPTALEVSGGPVRVVKQEYPAGIPLRLDVGAGEVLSTYQGEFRVRLQVLAAAKGDAELEGTLRYQACDAHSCYPPKNLPVHVAVTAK
jgi:hypothetical protein